MSLSLEGNKPATINAVGITLISAVFLATLLGRTFSFFPFFSELLLKSSARTGTARVAGHPSCWVLSLLTISYSLLIPGLVCTVFSMNIGAMGSMSLKHNTENTMTFVHALASDGCWLGSVFLVAFAVVIPSFKLLMLGLGELWRHSPSPDRLRRARLCIHCLQLVSKWACPDMFAYIFLLYLVRGMDKPPTLNGLFQLDVGFTCFCLFCLGSTVSALGIRLPESPSKVGECEERPSTFNQWATRLGAKGVLILAVCLTAVSTVLLVLGASTPCMALRLEINTLFDNGTIPNNPVVRKFVEKLDLPNLAKADVCIWQCIMELARWTMKGEVNSFLALVMLGVHVVAFTVLDIILLNLIAIGKQCNSMQGNTGGALRDLHAVSEATRVLKKLSMLDVLVVGVVIVVLSGSIYKKQGMVLSVGWGLFMLLGAEICHHILYLIVTSSAELPKCADAKGGVAAPEDVVVSERTDAESVDSSRSERTVGPNGGQ